MTSSQRARTMPPKLKWAIIISSTLVAGYLVLEAAAPRQAQRVITTGTVLSELVSGDTAIVVIYDPATCFECDNLMPRLQEWSEQHPGRLAIVLTRPAMSEERDQMALLRIEPAGVVRGDILSRLVGPHFHSEVLLFVNGAEAKSERYDPTLSERTEIMNYVIEGRT